MKTKYNLLIASILTLIILTTTLAIPILAQEKHEEQPPEEGDTPWWKEERFNGTFIHWDKQTEEFDESWSWLSQTWEFGPYPTYKIFLQNGTEVIDTNCIPLGENFNVIINIKKTVFTGNVTFGRAGLDWHAELRSQNGTHTGEAHCRMFYVNEMETHYWNESDTWHTESFVFNQSNILAPPEEAPFPKEEGEHTGFYLFDEEQSTVTETGDMWIIEIVGSFNPDTAPIGPFWVNLEVTDSRDNWIDFGYAAWEGKISPHRMVAVGKPGLMAGGFSDTWTFEKLDMENKQIYSVSRGAPWKMRINVTSAELHNVTIGFELDWNVKTFVNITGWYQTTVTEYGGWVHNETSGTYYWNDTVPVSKVKDVYGPHLEERWINVDHGRRVNVTRRYWDPETEEELLETVEEYVQEKMYIIYDHQTHNFSIKQGYSYWSYDPTTRMDREHLIQYPINISDPTAHFYYLLIEDCSWTQTAVDQYAIEFVGSFSNTTYSDRNDYWVNEPIVYNKYERIWPDWETISPSDFQIAVDTLVAITTIIDGNGQEVRGWMFQTDPGDSFTIQSKLQGAGVKYKDIDGVGVVFRTSSGNWVSEEENYWSDVEIQLAKDFTTDQLISTTYNRTGKNVYVYGPYIGREFVNVTDWHQEYNVTTSGWEWVESPRLMWNETTLTDWHWEYLSLNQTEYALNPYSSKAWINRDEHWIPDDDPAFKMPESYAILNSASISLIQGVVTVNLSVSFLQNAPHTNYWWEMCFKNMTFGRDWSQGWGEHTVLDWTTEQVYYVNSSITGHEPWYASEPTTPLYTLYNGERYRLEEVPYIILSSENLLINPKIHYDWGRQEDVREYLFWDQYDPELGTEPRYYELFNKTEICVTEAYQAVIRTLRLTTPDAYTLTDTGQASLDNGSTFNTFMDQAMEDWSKEYWDEELHQQVIPYYYELLNGTRIYMDHGFETQIYNFTTNRWDLFNKTYDESQTALLVDRLGQGVTLNQTLVLLREYGSWWQMLPDGTGYYLVMHNGTIITHADPWSVPDEERIVNVNGLNYVVSWPDEYYKGTYQDQVITINRNYVHNYYYTNLGIEGDKLELPYPGALAMSWWDLENIESRGGRLRTFKSITINGTAYTLQLTEDGQDYYILVQGEPMSITRPIQDIGYFYAEINGEEYWNIEQGGWILRLGTFSERSGQFIPAGSPLLTTTGYDPQSQMWNENNRWGYDRENSTLYIVAPNGTRYDVHSRIYVAVFGVAIGNETYYTMNDHEDWEMVEIPETGEVIYQAYITTLEGTKIHFDWDKNPVSWTEEFHIPIPGANYSRLIPFNSEPQDVFDTIYIHNITIPALPLDPLHTDVFDEGGVEVPVNATFKVFGTRWGPGTRHHYSWNDGRWFPEGVFIPGTQAPWNETMYVQYFTTLNGSRIYSEYDFGWIGDHWGDPAIGELRQWNYNTDLTSGNRTANVVEGGYCIFLNDTIKVDVTTEWPQGGWPDEYLMMKNGTVISVHWLSDSYITELSNKTYFFRQVLTYYNVTDSGIICNVVDPFNSDFYQILTPSVQIVPTIDLSRTTWILLNTTSDSLLQDLLGYYLVNATDFTRVDVGLVSDWWSLSESLRKNVFRNEWELEDAYPRYNITLDGQQYFLLDPSPVVGRWDGELCIEGNTYRYPAFIIVNLNGQNYTINLLESSNWIPELRWRRIETITLSGDLNLEVEEQHWWKPYYRVTIDGQPSEITLDEMNIYKKHVMWGEVYRWMLVDMQVHSIRSIWDIIVGEPEQGMWGIRAFSVVPETGAVDLDGDLTTVDDQYFVRRLHRGSDVWNRTEDRMFVEILWDPNASMMDDEIHTGAWMGKVHTEWNFMWNETYIWYHADSMSLVSHATMQQINATLIDNDTGTPNPGYWDIAHMAKNQTWADLLARAKKEGWDWIDDNSHEWDWLWFGTQQDYATAWSDGNSTRTAGIGLRYEFAGLALYNESEQTHFFVPEDVVSIGFVTPGEAFGNTNATGEIIVPLDSTISFGVSYENVTGTLFPFKEDRSMWGWWDAIVHGADFDEPNFLNKPTRTMIDEMAFAIHFEATTNADSEMNNNASMKIDQHIGDWDVDPYVIDGRKQSLNNVSTFYMGNDVFLNRSLAINYYVTAFTDMSWDLRDERGEQLTNNNVTESSRFDIAAKLADANFASVKLGSTYDWHKPVSMNDTIRTLNVTSKTTPIGSFEASFNSESGKSSTGFEISAMMYFLTVGFEKWDGYAVYNDPELVFYAFKGLVIPPSEFGLGSIPQLLFLILTSGTVSVVIVLVVFRKKIRKLISRTKSVKQSRPTESAPTVNS